MENKWYIIAKAELLAKTSKFRRARKPLVLLLCLFALIWAVYIVPNVVRYLLVEAFEGSTEFLTVAFPSLMRTAVLVFSTIVLVFPISDALSEVRTGHWEIMLSSNIRTRDILVGTYLSRIPIYGLLILFMCPILLSPFVVVLEISVIGQLLMYGVLTLLALTFFWISNVLSIAIQAKLGESQRGNDIGKALSWVVILIVAFPAMLLMYFPDVAAQIMSENLAILLPTTWVADLLTTTIIHTNGIYIPSYLMNYFNSLVHFDPMINVILLLSFLIIFIGLGLMSADRLFSLGAGVGSTRVTTVGKENIYLRLIRKIAPGHRGILIVTSLKDFGRKAQNYTKLGYALILTTLMILILKYGPLAGVINDQNFLPMMTILYGGFMLAVIGGITFGGVGFLDSRDQLWLLKSTPRGQLKFIAARIISHLLFVIPLLLISTVVNWLIMGLTVLELGLMLFYNYVLITCTILVGIGITAFNPSYEDTSSSAFTINNAVTVFSLFITTIVGLILGIITVISEGDLLLGVLNAIIPLPIVSMSIFSVGTIRFVTSEAYA